MAKWESGMKLKIWKYLAQFKKYNLKRRQNIFLNNIVSLIVKCNVIHLQNYQVKSGTSALPLFKTPQTLIIVSLKKNCFHIAVYEFVHLIFEMYFPA